MLLDVSGAVIFKNFRPKVVKIRLFYLDVLNPQVWKGILYMRRRAVLTLRGAAVSLMLGALVVSLAACSDSAPPATEGKSESAWMQDTIADKPVSSEGNRQTASETTRPTPAVVPVVSTAVSSDEGRAQSSFNPTEPPATTPGEPASDAGSVTPEQMVAAFESVLYGIYEKALPSVVYIRVPTLASEAFRGMQGVPDSLLWSAGSGFVWDSEGHIVTNHHVVEEAIGISRQVTVEFADSTQAKGTVVGSDPHSDLAVVKLEDGDWNLKPATLGDSDAVRVGQLTVAIGAPFGQEFTMTSGIVSAVGRNISGQARFSIPEVIQTDSAINPGNSGGPLLDRLGQVIGINTQIISNTGNFSGVGMAVPVNIAKRVVPPLIAEGEFNYPWLGVRIATVDALYAEALELPKGARGALIVAIVEDSPADRAGLRASESDVEIDGVEFPAGGDIITAIGPHQVAGSDELIAHLTYHNSPGDTVTFTVLRDGEQKEIEVTLGQRPEFP